MLFSIPLVMFVRLLLVDDDEEHLEMLGQYLSLQKYTVDLARNGSEASEYLQRIAYDVVILDWTLPDFSGAELCREYRLRGGNTPVLFLTGKSGITDIEEALQGGGDDYLTKPFNARELLARIRALLRRPAKVQSLVLQVRDVELNVLERSVTKNGATIKLYPKEYELLELFMRNPNRVFDIEKLMITVWPDDCSVSTETVRQTISRLRSALGHAKNSPLIRTVHGFGYKLEA